MKLNLFFSFHRFLLPNYSSAINFTDIVLSFSSLWRSVEVWLGEPFASKTLFIFFFSKAQRLHLANLTLVLRRRFVKVFWHLPPSKSDSEMWLFQYDSLLFYWLNFPSVGGMANLNWLLREQNHRSTRQNPLQISADWLLQMPIRENGHFNPFSPQKLQDKASSSEYENPHLIHGDGYLVRRSSMRMDWRKCGTAAS